MLKVGGRFAMFQLCYSHIACFSGALGLLILIDSLGPHRGEPPEAWLELQRLPDARLTIAQSSPSLDNFFGQARRHAKGQGPLGFEGFVDRWRWNRLAATVAAFAHRSHLKKSVSAKLI